MGQAGGSRVLPVSLPQHARSPAFLPSRQGVEALPGSSGSPGQRVDSGAMGFTGDSEPALTHRQVPDPQREAAGGATAHPGLRPCRGSEGRPAPRSLVEGPC